MKPSSLTQSNLRIAVGLAYSASFTAFLIWCLTLLIATRSVGSFFGCSYFFIIIVVNVYRSFFGLPRIFIKQPQTKA